MKWARRFGLLAGGGVLTAVSVACIVTPLLWELEGYSAESYPELGAFAYLLPAALVVLGAGAARVFSPRPWRRYPAAIFWTGVAIAISLWGLFFVSLAGWTPLEPVNTLMKALDALRNSYFVLLAACGMMVAIGWLTRQRRA